MKMFLILRAQYSFLQHFEMTVMLFLKQLRNEFFYSKYFNSVSTSNLIVFLENKGILVQWKEQKFGKSDRFIPAWKFFE